MPIFDFWTKPELLKKWWPPTAELTTGTGGSYHFLWPSQNWHLRGKFTAFSPGKRLGFTWKWDHESSDQTHVDLIFDSISRGGTKLTLRHGSYSSSEGGKKLRQEHIDCWMYFLGRLQEQTGKVKS